MKRHIKRIIVTSIAGGIGYKYRSNIKSKYDKYFRDDVRKIEMDIKETITLNGKDKRFTQDLKNSVRSKLEREIYEEQHKAEVLFTELESYVKMEMEKNINSEMKELFETEKGLRHVKNGIKLEGSYCFSPSGSTNRKYIKDFVGGEEKYNELDKYTKKSLKKIQSDEIKKSILREKVQHIRHAYGFECEVTYWGIKIKL